MTLMPVSRISTPGFCSAKAGGFLWMLRRGSSAPMGAPSSMTSPKTLNSRPSVHLPTGTRSPLPSPVTSMPRARPSLPESMMQRTVSLLRCCATSITRRAPSTSTDNASRMRGRPPCGKRTSTTLPDT